MKKISIAKIRVNGGTQSRAEINRETVAEYAEAMEGGAEFPPLVVFYDGSTYWLADGFHRYEAASRARQHEVMADIRQGSQRDAILHSVGANASHGLRRTNDDKRRAVMVLLNDPEWSKWSNREIARQCGVSERLVRDVRPICDKNADSAPRTVTRNGTTYEQNTANIGGSRPDQETPSELAASEGHPAPLRADPPHGGDGAGEPEHEWPVPPPDPYGYAKLTEEALLEAANGLRADLDDEKARRKKAEAEARTLKAKLADHTADDKDEVIRRLQAKVKHAEGQRYQAEEKFAAEKRKTFRLNKRVTELENEEVPLN